MPEFDFEDLVEQPGHYQDAERFIASVLDEVALGYPALQIAATNLTTEELDSYPATAKAAKLEGDPELVKEFYDMDRETDLESVSATRVMVVISGDEKGMIDKATKEINRKAGELGIGALMIDDSGISEHGGRESLPRIVKDRSKLEDLPLWQRYLGYKFIGRG